MLDQLNKNPLSVTGTPSLVTGALTVDTDQALSWNGTTNSASATDSTSLSITGSMSIELFVRLAALPGATRDIVRKTGSYAVQVNTSGQVLFVLTGPSSSVTLTSNVTLTLNRWYHLVCVYNGNYAGAQQFGKTSIGSQKLTIDDDNGRNKLVGKFSLPERAVLNSINVALQYFDEMWPVNVSAVVYADDAGVPAALVCKSDVVLLNPPNPQHKVFTWLSFPLNQTIVSSGDYHIGLVVDTVKQVPLAVLAIARETSGGTTSARPDSVSSPSDPFGTVAVAGIDALSVYCNYQAVGRTGFEGKALIYIDGALNVSSVYTGGIADTANALEVCPAVAAQVDELSIWNKALTPVQVATHYTAH